MPDARVIYDSEEDDEGFSPVRSPAVADDGPAFMVGNSASDSGPSLGAASDSRSTDPELFKQLYEAQSRRPAESFAADMQTRNSSSLTDPTMRKGAKRATHPKMDGNDFAALTHVTTPSAPSISITSAKKDVYDFRLSDEEEESSHQAYARPAKTRTAATTSTKRKAAEPTAQPKKKSKSDLQPGEHHPPCDDEDDIDLLVIPTTSEMDAQSLEAVRGDASSSVVPDTSNMDRACGGQRPTSFFIAPPNELTTSQKQEYLRVSDGSELGRGEQEPGSDPNPSQQREWRRLHGFSQSSRDERHQESCLPPQKVMHTQVHDPPNTESTIPYTTPSRYCSSAVLLPVVGSSHADISSDAMIQPSRAQPHSSPDELNSDSPPITKSNPKSKKRHPEPDELAHDDFWDTEKINFSRDACVPRPSRRGLRVEANSPPKCPMASTTISSTQRRMKAAARDTVVVQDDPKEFDEIQYHQEQHVPRASRRSSRAVLEEVEDNEQLEPLEQSMPDTCPPGEEICGTAHDPDPILASSGQMESQDNMKIDEGLDPEFLAAMPEDIRREIISNHIAQAGGTAQTGRTRSQARSTGDSSSRRPISEQAPQPKKRGRKKKEQKIDERSMTYDEMAADPRGAPTATTKRKRGRPKKSATPSAAATVNGEQPKMEVPTPWDEAFDEARVAPTSTAMPSQLAPEAPQASAKRGRKKKVVAAQPAATLPSCEPEEPVEPAQVLDEPEGKVQQKGKELEDPPEDSDRESAETTMGEMKRQALQDISNTASQDTPSEKVEVTKEVTSEMQSKENSKSASTPSHQGKVPLRIGLSKRSRIRPLLKCIRK